MKYYEARFTFESIEEVEVEKESDSSVWINGRMVRKSTTYSEFFQNREDAKNYLLRKAQTEIDAAKRRLEYYEERLLKVRAL